MGRRGAHTVASIAVAVVSFAIGAATAAIAAGVLFPSESKGCQPDVEKCPSFVDWHAGLVSGSRVTIILLVIGLLVVGVSYRVKPPPPSEPFPD
jgi:hypothetical protein